MTKTRPFAELAAEAKADPRRRARIAEYTRAIDDALSLGQLRREQGMAQGEVAGTLDVSQANVSRIEHEQDVYLSTLRNYVAALGGRLEVVAVFPDRAVTLVGAATTAEVSGGEETDARS